MPKLLYPAEIDLLSFITTSFDLVCVLGVKWTAEIDYGTVEVYP